MRFFHLIISLAVLGLVIWLNQAGVPVDSAVFGGLSWIGWASILLVGLLIGFLVLANDSARAFGLLRGRDRNDVPPARVRVLDPAELKELGIEKYRGPVYPHPIIFTERCIGCQACVDACPHDVLAIVDGVASAIAPDLCMEDTACQAACPVNPKACIVINTAKEVRSMPTPTRDGSTYQTNVPGCYIIGDVSGVPLIKNAVKEGAEVIAGIVADLQASPSEPKADHDVAIIGIGPGGASAAAAASDANLRYVGIEQDKILSTIELYPKGKYIFFKPDTKDWIGGVSVAGLGLGKAKYGAADGADDSQSVIDAIGGEISQLIEHQASVVHAEMLTKIPTSLHVEISTLLTAKITKELKKRVSLYLHSKGQTDWPKVFRTSFAPVQDALFENFRKEISDQLQKKIPGDQRENILELWHRSLAAKPVHINENESCKAIDRAADGDYFIVRTERGAEKSPQTYTARRVVIAVGLRGAPNKLRLPNESLTIRLDGNERPKVSYGLSNPMDFRGKHLVVVGGGNVAVEAAVDLVAVRDGSSITPRKPEDMNRVTMLVREHLAPTVKFGNKYHLYNCADNGLIDLRLGIGIREMRENELVLEDVKTKQVVDTIQNDLVFALIGGERPDRFLESIGITIK